MQEKRKYNQKATQKQITALQLMAQGQSGRQAMLKAGYSKTMAEHPKQLLQSNAVVTMIDKMQLQLKGVNITTSYLATKLKEWLDASDPIITAIGPIKDPVTGEIMRSPDYKTQLAAYDRIANVFGLKPSAADASNLKRKITLEEFAFDPGNNQDSDMSSIDSNTKVTE